MKATKYACAAAIITILLALLLGGCAGAYVAVRGPESRAPSAKGDPRFPLIRNNATVRLQAADYIGDLNIGANNVTIIGRGPELTRIRGNVTITGNKCTMHQLTIAGSVFISGNSADLRGARIQGVVRSTGNNNHW